MKIYNDIIIKTPVIGIPRYRWQKLAVKFIKSNPHFVDVDISDFCYECDRQIELLPLFDENVDNFYNTKYWKYYENKKNENTIISKIERYKRLYDKIKREGYKNFEDRSSIIVTDDGCRIDGSHRISILLHLNICKIKVNVFVYEKLFSIKESKSIRKINKKYRKDIYNL